MLYITLVCIAYIIGILWGLFLTKVGYSPFILLIIAILVYFRKNPQVNKERIIKGIILIVFLSFGLINIRLKANDFESKYVNKSSYNFSGYIERFISSEDKYNKYLFSNEDNDNFIIYIKNKFKVEEDTKISFLGNFVKPSHARNHGRL